MTSRRSTSWSGFVAILWNAMALAPSPGPRLHGHQAAEHDGGADAHAVRAGEQCASRSGQAGRDDADRWSGRRVA